MIAHFSDGTGVVDLIWFQGIKYLIGKYKVHQEYIVFGKPSVFNGRINIAHPDIDPASELKLSAMGLQPYYNTTEKMKRSSLNSHAIEKMMKNIVRQLDEPLPETLSPALLAEHHLMPLTEALMNIHFPVSPDVLRKAEYRLKFEELFYVQLNILRYAKDRQRKYRGYVFEKVGDTFNGFYSRNLPFELTNAQKRVLKEIRRDLGSGRQMNRLLQGDVGSGKTLVALMSMLMALDNGYQACMMAPTEILANQHYDTIRELLYGMDVRVELLTGSIKGKRREAILSGLLTGDVQILIGTQMIVKGHDFSNVTLVGVLAADMSLHVNDFHAAERTFALLTQAAGRAGRGKLPGNVVIQTYDPDHYAIRTAKEQDYEAFYDKEIEYRRLMNYPPVWNMLLVHVTSPDESECSSMAQQVYDIASQMISHTDENQSPDDRHLIQLIGPADANIAKVNDIYRKVIYMKTSDYAALISIKDVIEQAVKADTAMKHANISFDFNPMSGF
mgnify:CR=1 FL=1